MDSESDFDRRLLREKLASLKEFAYGASHELNNPLFNISSRAQLLLRDERDPERRGNYRPSREVLHGDHDWRQNDSQHPTNHGCGSYQLGASQQRHGCPPLCTPPNGPTTL